MDANWFEHEQMSTKVMKLDLHNCNCSVASPVIALFNDIMNEVNMQALVCRSGWMAENTKFCAIYLYKA